MNTFYADALRHAREFGRPPFNAGQRVEANPGCDCWMRGDRFGTVEKIGRAFVHVRMDRSGRLLRFHPVNLIAL